ncbi:MAG TPA: hypothetical protein VJ874_05045 [Candidatus Thermoplasmatota archaeon]|nr:hypothetical protein [Candidatus Thermoplasmatota archaeon]
MTQTAQAYEVTKRGVNGEPLEITCRFHPACTWRLASTGPKRDDDAIFLAMVGAHISERSTPDRQASGHERRKRR